MSESITAPRGLLYVSPINTTCLSVIASLIARRRRSFSSSFTPFVISATHSTKLIDFNTIRLKHVVQLVVDSSDLYSMRVSVLNSTCAIAIVFVPCSRSVLNSTLGIILDSVDFRTRRPL